MSHLNPRTDRRILTREAYATDEHLSVRYQIHERYSEPRIDFQKWVSDIMPWRGDEWVLDVGAGSGSYFQWVRQAVPQGYLVAGDLSLGMARQAAHSPYAAGVSVLALDVQNLPFPGGCFDVVLANHMLYHVPDLDQALVEIRRVLRADGCLVAATNSENTMLELDTLMRRAYALLGYPKLNVKPIHSQFTLENGGGRLGRYFTAVARYDLPSEFHFPEVEPVMAYINSMRAIREPALPPGVTWEQFMEVIEKQASRLIRHFGELQVHKLAGVLVATNGGGFAADYLHRLHDAP